MLGELSIGAEMSWIARMLRTRFDARARNLGLTRAQWQMIATIRYVEGTTQSEAASRLEINTVTAGRIIDRLEAAGWVERRADPADRRANRLYVSPSATPILAQLDQIGADEDRVLLRGLTDGERAMLANMLKRIIANLQEPTAEAMDPEEVIKNRGLAKKRR